MPVWLIPILLPILITASYAGISAAPWVPTRRRELELLLSTMPDLKDGLAVDLGSGTGTILFAIARRYPEAKLVGYEISLLPWLAAWLRVACSPVKYRNVSFRLQSLYRADLSEAKLVTCFLLPSAYPKVIPIISKKLGSEAWLAVEGWPLPNIELDHESKTELALSLYWYKGASFNK